MHIVHNVVTWVNYIDKMYFLKKYKKVMITYYMHIKQFNTWSEKKK